jgi:hypothetical protein
VCHPRLAGEEVKRKEEEKNCGELGPGRLDHKSPIYALHEGRPREYVYEGTPVTVGSGVRTAITDQTFSPLPTRSATWAPFSWVFAGMPVTVRFRRFPKPIQMRQFYIHIGIPHTADQFCGKQQSSQAI